MATAASLAAALVGYDPLVCRSTCSRNLLSSGGLCRGRSAVEPSSVGRLGVRRNVTFLCCAIFTSRSRIVTHIDGGGSLALLGAAVARDRLFDSSIGCTVPTPTIVCRGRSRGDQPSRARAARTCAPEIAISLAIHAETAGKPCRAQSSIGT